MSPANSIGFPFIELHTVDSTNNYAMGLVHAGMAQHGAVVFAHEQTQGKGQRNKQWVTTRNENIILSLIVQPFGKATSELFQLSMAVGVGVRRFFSKYAGIETKVKWPNDLYWCDRKAGGILIENIFHGMEWKYAVIGIGLNLNQTSFLYGTKAVSLKQITGKNFDTIAMAKELIAHLDASFQMFLHKPTDIFNEYAQHLFKQNEKVRLKQGSRVFEALIKGVTMDGRLVVEHGTEEFFETGEVEWLL